MKKLFSFQCTSCHSIYDEYTEYKQTSSCPSCGNEANKIITSPTIKLEGITGAFPGAAAKWERMHKSMGSKQRD